MGEADIDKPLKKKRRPPCIFGNYKSYYGYRIGHEMDEDPRLSVFRREWFEGKDCLDIGCNEGLVTIAVAKKFCCRSILGVDIDANLIDNAKWNLRRVARLENAKDQLLESTARDDCVEQQVHDSIAEERLNHPNKLLLSQHSDLFDKVSFQKENFVGRLSECSEKYDAILCLSVTKWVHLNWGDDGLITLFAKIWRLLRPGGILVLEPQPWQSYQRKRLVSETANSNFYDIMFRPAYFQEILLDKIGFRSVERITDNLSGCVAGFDRPIFAYHK